MPRPKPITGTITPIPLTNDLNGLIVPSNYIRDWHDDDAVWVGWMGSFNIDRVQRDSKYKGLSSLTSFPRYINVVSTKTGQVVTLYLTELYEAEVGTGRCRTNVTYRGMLERNELLNYNESTRIRLHARLYDID